MDGTAQDVPVVAVGGRDVVDKRGQGRKAVLKRAQVVFDNAAIDCIVENMSDSGARVRFGHPVALPEVVSLRFNDGTSHTESG